MRSFSLAIILLVLVFSGERNPASARTVSSRIVNGEKAKVNQFPWHVSIRSHNLGLPSACGGSIISENWILTAAQCVSGHTHFTIGLGSNEWNKPNISVISQEAIIHPKFGDRLQNDVALIKLPISIEFSDSIQPIKLPFFSQSSITFEGSKVIASGWGLLSDGSGKMVDDLMFANLRVISNSDCTSYYGSLINSGVLCSQGTQGSNICDGDFGGPLIVQEENSWTQIGIVSFFQNCTSGKPSGYTRVSAFLEWISNETDLSF